MGIKVGSAKTIVNEVAKFKKDEIEFLFELIKNSMIPGQHLGIAMDIVNKLKSQYQLLNRKGAVVKTTKSTNDVVKENIEKVQQEIKEQDGELFIKE